MFNAGLLFALVAAVCSGIASIFFKSGLVRIAPTFASLISIGITVLISWILFFSLFPLYSLFSEALPLFILAGLISPGMTRILYFESIKRVGVTVTQPIVSASSLFVLFPAIFVLNENINLPLLVACLLVFLGIVILEKNVQGSLRGKKILKSLSPNLLMPISVSMLVALCLIIRKMGLETSNSAFVLFAVSSSSGFLFYTFFLTTTGRIGQIRSLKNKLSKKPLLILTVGSFFFSGTWLFKFLALGASEIVAIAPVLNTGPLFTMGLSYCFFRDTEKITYKTALGTVMIVLGIALLGIE